MDPRITALQNALNLTRVRPTSVTFARSLLDQYARRGSLSASQWLWVERLANEAFGSGSPVPAVGAAAAPAVPSYAAPAATIRGWLMHARGAGLRRPAVRYPRLTLTAPGSTSRHANTETLFVRLPQSNNVYAGRITNGVFYRSGDAPANIGEMLAEVMADPLDFAVRTGQRTGRCCFCARELTDGRSVAMGYGPICADHYNLPWGSRRVDTVVADEREVLAAEAANAGAEMIDVTTIGSPHRESVVGMVRANVSRTFQRLSLRGSSPVSACADDDRAAFRNEVAGRLADTRPITRRVDELPSFEDGGPDAEDREFC